ncbi:LacI family DNA-binding transcriptional regulator [Arthrobacter gengyunqii]|uniref:LacI family DNA-binding transcriptional regulator n=1 Tax=Arthrobacter gengyunqii TaxID=2886940 RepID=A0A9X1S6R9_9MICC|nr:LacI family DNA-binding transcriptional regulator [Arthrobacter gengyunqii]MCC3270118.1 LacI family DNA-binding transcriptional regulator [Arthrobacter gengyunqii]UOY96824.1 LacI family DNA-binding transcriptional regulator [Arthrobacter gengyunqii]
MATSKRVTLADVARRAGLSSSAASMILNGRPDTRLSKDAHDRVNRAAAELGYRPNVAARSLRMDKTQTIGFVSDTVATTRFASGLIKGALAAAERAGHVILLAETGGDHARETEAIAALLDRQVDGIVFAATRARELFIPALQENVPVVLLNAINEHFPVSVLPDEERGGRAAVSLLADAGHKEGIFLIGHDGVKERNVFRSTTVARRLDGIRAEMKDRGLSFEREESIWDWEPQNGYACVHELLNEVPQPRALICLNDPLAFGAYQALTEKGLRVPEDVSIVSFDNDEIASYLRPGLTTIGLPHEEMGRLAVELLLDGAKGGEHLVDMPVIVRASIKKRDQP